MSNAIVGSCPHCGAPIYSPSMWHAVCPPPAYKSCLCISTAKQQEVGTTTGEIYDRTSGMLIKYKQV